MDFALRALVLRPAAERKGRETVVTRILCFRRALSETPVGRKLIIASNGLWVSGSTGVGFKERPERNDDAADAGVVGLETEDPGKGYDEKVDWAGEESGRCSMLPVGVVGCDLDPPKRPKKLGGLRGGLSPPPFEPVASNVRTGTPSSPLDRHCLAAASERSRTSTRRTAPESWIANGASRGRMRIVGRI